MVARGWGYALIKAIEADDVPTVRQALSMAGVALDEQLVSWHGQHDSEPVACAVLIAASVFLGPLDGFGLDASDALRHVRHLECRCIVTV